MAKTKKAVSEQLCAQVFDAMPLGLFIIGQDHRIYAWNTWMAANTKIAAMRVIGKTLSSLYKDTINLRFISALEVVLKYGHPQILTTTLNKFVIPIPLDKHAYPDFEMMQQNTQILPIEYQNQAMALVIIQDVSDKAHLKNTLIRMATKFENNSLIDALTDLYNRRFLWKYLENELKTARRKHYNVICCLYDLDYFKKINDELGHAAGDEVLVSFSQLAKSIIRPSDYLFRYGGEEFLAVYTRIDLTAATTLSNRIRKKFAAAHTHGSVQHRKVTCSGGISYWQPSESPINAEKLVDKADMQLYKAKNFGRNCIVMAGSIVS